MDPATRITLQTGCVSSANEMEIDWYGIVNVSAPDVFTERLDWKFENGDIYCSQFYRVDRFLVNRDGVRISDHRRVVNFWNSTLSLAASRFVEFQFALSSTRLDSRVISVVSAHVTCARAIELYREIKSLLLPRKIGSVYDRELLFFFNCKNEASIIYTGILFQ